MDIAEDLKQYEITDVNMENERLQLQRKQKDQELSNIRQTLKSHINAMEISFADVIGHPVATVEYPRTQPIITEPDETEPETETAINSETHTQPSTTEEPEPEQLTNSIQSFEQKKSEKIEAIKRSAGMSKKRDL